MPTKHIFDVSQGKKPHEMTDPLLISVQKHPKFKKNLNSTTSTCFLFQLACANGIDDETIDPSTFKNHFQFGPINRTIQKRFDMCGLFGQ